MSGNSMQKKEFINNYLKEIQRRAAESMTGSGRLELACEQAALLKDRKRFDKLVKAYRDSEWDAYHHQRMIGIPKSELSYYPDRAFMLKRIWDSFRHEINSADLDKDLKEELLAEILDFVYDGKGVQPLTPL